MKLLLADDESYVTSVIGKKLAHGFEEVLTASDGEEALALARAHHPTIIVSDLQMPLMDGFMLACALRQDPSTATIPIILLSARSHLLTPTQLADTSIKRVLCKPFSIKQIIAAVDELLEGLSQNAA